MQQGGLESIFPAGDWLENGIFCYVSKSEWGNFVIKTEYFLLESLGVL